MIIDKEFTNDIRSRSMYFGPLFSESELDSLLDDDTAHMGDAHTLLAAELIERSTGLKVDMSNQGSAAHVLTQAGGSDNQAHNTITTTYSDEMLRSFDPDEVDVGTIPKITEDDVNRAGKSIDFPSARATGTALDGMRIGTFDNPAETALINELTTVQVFHHWGINVDSLIDFIDAEWGIDYTRRLITEVSLSNAADLELFVATGGRPSPVVYVSPNMMSFYKVDQSVMVSAQDANATSAFWGRMRNLAKFTHATENLLRGRGSRITWSGHVHPSHLCYFNPKTLAGYTASTTIVPSLAPSRTSICGLESFEKFIGSRMSAAASAAIERVDFVDIAGKVEKYSRPRCALSYQAAISAASPGILTTYGIEVDRTESSKFNASPKRVLAVLMSHFHGPIDSDKLTDLQDFCSVFGFLGMCGGNATDYASHWGAITHNRGFARALRSINLEDAKKNVEIRALINATDHQYAKRVACLYLVARSISGARASLGEAWGATMLWVTYRTSPTAITNPQYYWVGDQPALARMFNAVLSKVMKIRPFALLPKHIGAARSQFAHQSMLRTDKASLMNALLADKAWGDYVEAKNRKVGERKMQFRRIRPLFASTRREWCAYYYSLSRAAFDATFLHTQMYPKCKPCAHVVVAAAGDEVAVANAMYNAGLFEAAICFGRGLAFEFAQVRFQEDFADYDDDSTRDPVDLLRCTVEAYKNHLATRGEPTIFVDMKLSAFGSKSKLTKKCDQLAMSLLTRDLQTVPSATLAFYKSVIIDSYKGGARLVKGAVEELVTNDCEIVRSAAATVTDPDKCSCGRNKARGHDSCCSTCCVSTHNMTCGALRGTVECRSDCGRWASSGHDYCCNKCDHHGEHDLNCRDDKYVEHVVPDYNYKNLVSNVTESVSFANQTAACAAAAERLRNGSAVVEDVGPLMECARHMVEIADALTDDIFDQNRKEVNDLSNDVRGAGIVDYDELESAFSTSLRERIRSFWKKLCGGTGSGAIFTS